MAWKIEFADSAAKQLRKLDPAVARRIATFLRDRVVPAPDPRGLGAALNGDEPGQFWRYRVGDDRMIAEIHEREVRILGVRLGHRRDVNRSLGPRHRRRAATELPAGPTPVGRSRAAFGQPAAHGRGTTVFA